MAPDPAIAALDRITDLSRRHHHGHTSNPRRDYCTADNQDWPRDVTRLLAALDAATGALERHMHWCTDSRGQKLCGGCLSPYPCPDAGVIARALNGGNDRG